MKWRVPGKTFLLGEYAALAGKSALILTTSPFFELTLSEQQGLKGIHSASPAGLLWYKEEPKGWGAQWHDPLSGLGGLGASSAQFLACFKALCFLQEKPFNLEAMLEAYHQLAWPGEGLKPSGYDMIAQSLGGCVYLNREKKELQTFSWPFKDLIFLLVHTGNKLATHEHLKKAILPPNLNLLSLLVDKAKDALIFKDKELLINAVNEYHYLLATQDLITPASLALIEQLKKEPQVRAIKGCGALGADVLLLLIETTHLEFIKKKLAHYHLRIIATNNHLTAA